MCMYIWNGDGGEAEDEEAFETNATVEIKAARSVIPPAGVEDFFEYPACNIFEQASDNGASEEA